MKSGDHNFTIVREKPGVIRKHRAVRRSWDVEVLNASFRPHASDALAPSSNIDVPPESIEVSLLPNSQWVFCPNPTSSFTALMSDVSNDYSCIAGPTITIEGDIEYLVKTASIQSIRMEDPVTGVKGRCEFISTKYRCIAPYDGVSWDGTLSIDTADHVCGSTNNQFNFGPLTTAGSPYSLRLTIARSQANCPILQYSF